MSYTRVLTLIAYNIFEGEMVKFEAFIEKTLGVGYRFSTFVLYFSFFRLIHIQNLSQS